LNSQQINDLFNIDIYSILDNSKINDIKEAFRSLKGKELIFREIYDFNSENAFLGTVK